MGGAHRGGFAERAGGDITRHAFVHLRATEVEARQPRVRSAQRAQGRIASSTRICIDRRVLRSRAHHDSRVVRPLRRLVSRAQAAIRRARLRRPGGKRRAAAGGSPGCPAPLAKPIRPGADGRVPGYQWPTGPVAAVAAAAGPLLCRRRHQPVDLRIPPRRTARVSGISRRRRAGWQTAGATGRELPQPSRDFTRSRCGVSRRRRHRDAAADRGPAVFGQGGAVGGGAVGDHARVGGAMGGRAHSGAEMRIPGRRPPGAQLRSAPRFYARFRRVRHSVSGQSRERILRDA